MPAPISAPQAVASRQNGAPAPQLLSPALEQVRRRIGAAEQACGRAPGSVTLLAVTKAFGPEAVAAAAALGQTAFGENYVQEALAKMEAVRIYAGLPPLQWHFIGPIQSNKTRQIAEHFDWVQSVDRLAIAGRLSTQRPAAMGPLQVLLQVNISGESTKSGVAPDEVAQLAVGVAALPGLRLRGLMAVPQAGLPAPEQHRCFARLRELLQQLQSRLRVSGLVSELDTLSMGMSADFEAAIAEGSTMVRVGSAIFGERA